MKCDYCGKERPNDQITRNKHLKNDPPPGIVGNPPMGICTSCNSKVSEVLISETPFDDQGLIELTLSILGHGSDEPRLEALRKSEVPDVGEGQIVRDRECIKSLLSASIYDWPPIKVKQVVNPMFGEPLGVDYEVVDGWHRLAVANALGYLTIPVFDVGDGPLITEDCTFIYGHDRPYHTLVYPNGIISGVRDNERWEYLRAQDHLGKRILDIGSNIGMQGILARYVGAAAYTGIDENTQAIELGRQVADAWGVAVELINYDARGIVLPNADVMWLFSIAQRIPIEYLVDATKRVDPEVVYLEWHDLVDDASANLQSQLNYEWELLAVLQSSFDNERRCRKLLRGTRIT